MQKLLRDPFYETLKAYDRLAVDYCLMESAYPHRGYLSHKEAVLYAARSLCEEYPWVTVDAEKATGKEIPSERLFALPDKPWRTTAHDTTLYHAVGTEGGRIPYWYAFLEPPHKTGPVIRNGVLLRDTYGREDFETVNRALFPMGTDALEVCEWSTDWSNYFDAGREWWGTLCLSVFDRKLNRYAVIMASSAD